MRMGTVADIPAILRFFADNREFLDPYLPSRPPLYYQAEAWEKRRAGDRERFDRDETC